MGKVTKKGMILASVITLVLLLSNAFPVFGNGNGAIVYNHPDEWGWTMWFIYDDNWNKYVGQFTYVMTPSGNFTLQWNAELVYGNPVEKNKKVHLYNFLGYLEGTVVLTPSGNAHGTFHY